MVKKTKGNISKEETAQVEAPTQTPEAAPAEPEVAPIEAPEVAEAEATKIKENKPQAKKEPVELPKDVLEYFKRCPDVKEAYFDKLGGIFSTSTPKTLLKDAVLYQNPEY